MSVWYCHSVVEHEGQEVAGAPPLDTQTVSQPDVESVPLWAGEQELEVEFQSGLARLQPEVRHPRQRVVSGKEAGLQSRLTCLQPEVEHPRQRVVSGKDWDWCSESQMECCPVLEAESLTH